MKDPYKVLGVPPDASDDEIKKAYRALARKYHPDNYNGSDLADLAEEKMKEVNEAYDAVKKMRETGQSYSGQSTSSYSSGSYSGGLAEARRLIAAGSYANAELILDSISVNERGAEWNYLKGCIMLRRGAYFDARRHIETACYMDPGNEEYRKALSDMDVYARRYGQGQMRTDSTGVCDVCSTLICADCLCEMCGGDLIPCC